MFGPSLHPHDIVLLTSEFLRLCPGGAKMAQLSRCRISGTVDPIVEPGSLEELCTLFAFINRYGSDCALNLRAGAAAVEGETVIRDAWQIFRGYDRFIEKLNRLGAKAQC